MPNRFYILDVSGAVKSGPHSQKQARLLAGETDKIATAEKLEAIKRRPVGRPPAAGSRRQVVVSITIPPEYRDWLDERGDRSEQIRQMIAQAMERPT